MNLCAEIFGWVALLLLNFFTQPNDFGLVVRDQISAPVYGNLRSHGRVETPPVGVKCIFSLNAEPSGDKTIPHSGNGFLEGAE